MIPLNIEVSATMLLLALSFILWYGLYRPILLEGYRQRLFEIRHQLFMFAAKGHLSFDSPIYDEVNDSINGYIKVAHRLTLFNLFLISILHRKTLTNGQDTCGLYSVVSGISEDNIRNEIQDIVDKIYLVSGLYLALTTPLLWLPLLVTALFALIPLGCKTIKQETGNLFNKWFGESVDAIRDAELGLVRVR